MENKIVLKSISELLGMKFLIPSYQRGYRWTTQQVLELLEDIFKFSPTKGEWYCLQPIVAKKNYNNNIWEIIDGQQRLTTIFLIIHYFNEMWIGKQKINEPIITYQTRSDSTNFLNNIKVNDDDSVKINEENIDYQHISVAYKTIHNWVKEKGHFDINDFQSKFKEKTKVIWYETDQSQDPVEIFTRINIGKISLTSAELIKALFLNTSNFRTDNAYDKEKIRLKQLEIASEWDFIEYSLHNEELWWFINKENNEKEPRIEFIFEMIVGKPHDISDEYYVFREFCKKIEDISEKNIEKNWKQIKRIFQTFQNWFDNRDLYHKIGFLVTEGENLKALLDESFLKNKIDFLKYIDMKIRNKFQNIDIENIRYEDRNVKSILLLHNIQTMLNNSKENSRFPFNRYKQEKWDIEHIHAIATEMPKTEQYQKDWLEQSKEFLDEKIKEDKDLLEEISQYSKDKFEQLFSKILDRFSEDKHEDIDNLSNLALLDTETNRSYKNAIFPFKRKIIIEKERKGTFVPICTKNAFMKYYNSKIEQTTFWGKEDRKTYLDDIEAIFNKIRKTNNE